MSDKDKTLSKFLSLILRHKPETIGLSLDENGWADVDELLQTANAHEVALTGDILQRIVATNDKKRFVFSEDQRRIQANQGHSLNVDLQLVEAQPPDLLFHGTALRFIDSIRSQGLIKGQRHHVHLSTNKETARSVGSRYGKPVIIEVKAAEMHLSGARFYQSENGVWLTEHVPVAYLDFGKAD